MIRAHALLPHALDTSPGQRFRLEQWKAPLREFGVDLELSVLLERPEDSNALRSNRPTLAALSALATRTARRAATILSERPDVWIVSREATLVGPAVLERLARSRAPLVFDFDDSVWLSDAGENAKPTLRSRLRWARKVNDVLAFASGVSAGNQYLADYALRFNSRVEVVPTTVDVRGAYAMTKGWTNERLGAPITIGWSGSSSTATYIRGLLPTLAEIAQQVDIKLLVVGAQHLSYPGLRIECRPWRSETEVQDLLDMDIGLMPLTDDEWARGKCGLKALQYMGLGIPAIVSPVGVNTEIVAHGVNGYHATDPASWHRAISLLTEPAQRIRLGRNARETVEQRYSAEVAARTLAGLLHDVVR